MKTFILIYVSGNSCFITTLPVESKGKLELLLLLEVPPITCQLI